MANYEILKTAIQNAVDWNNNDKQISGNDMLTILLSIINQTVCTGYLLVGVANPNTNPGTPDQMVAYIAGQSGAYHNFGYSLEKYELAVFKYSNGWSKETIFSGDALRSIENKVGSSDVLFDASTANAFIDGSFQAGDVIRMIIGPGTYEAVDLYGYRSDDTFVRIGGGVPESSTDFTLAENFVKLRVNSANAHQITLEKIVAGTWEPVLNYLTANFTQLQPIFASLLQNWDAIEPNAMRTYTKTATASGTYPQVNLSFDVRDGEWYNLTPVYNEMYIVWSDYSFTRIGGGWRKMEYPNGLTPLFFRILAPDGTVINATMRVVPPELWDVMQSIVGSQVNVLPPIRALILGDSYSANGGAWCAPMISRLPSGSSFVSLAVGSASLKDKYADRVTYPYTSRPVYTDNTGNHNTLACQIEKLKRLMEGTDLDPGETQLYTDPSQYPNVIIIAAGKNDNPDSAAAETTYTDQLNKIVTGVYRKRTSADAAEIGAVTIKTPLDEINRLCFAGAYRYLLDELLALFPDAQIYFCTISPISYRNGNDVSQISLNIARQQRVCADIFNATVIDWYRDGQINSVANYAQGSGTADDPYIWAECTLPNRDTNDQLHPNGRGGKKYGAIAANVIRATFMNIEDF